MESGQELTCTSSLLAQYATPAQILLSNDVYVAWTVVYRMYAQLWAMLWANVYIQPRWTNVRMQYVRYVRRVRLA